MHSMGWDIGGAHVKAVLLDEMGNVLQSQQIACPLWLGLDRLETALMIMLKTFNVIPNQVTHAVTMTGELVDLFENRHQGVVEISTLIDQLLKQSVLFYYMSQESEQSFVSIEGVESHAKLIASANWHASARLIAQQLPSALLVDIGSTTTDIIVIDGGKVVSGELTDAERMQQDTLVYTGVVRTPVMAVAQKLSLDSVETNVAAEYFATMADVYRLTQELPEAVDMAETADGEAKTILASARRLARMVGYDVESKPLESWQQLAQACKQKQCDQIQLAMTKHLKVGMTIVSAGAGSFLVEAIAQILQYPTMSVASAMQCQEELDVCFPAYAVASLACARSAT
jgi:probable H4MPT-linked C1 transfer pathway protein